MAHNDARPDRFRQDLDQPLEPDGLVQHQLRGEMDSIPQSRAGTKRDAVARRTHGILVHAAAQQHPRWDGVRTWPHGLAGGRWGVRHHPMAGSAALQRLKGLGNKNRLNNE